MDVHQDGGGLGSSRFSCPTEVAPDIRVEESPGSKRGQAYMSASGERIPNPGQQHIDFVTDEGRQLRGQYQVADVNRPLLSVGKICDNNKR